MQTNVKIFYMDFRKPPHNHSHKGLGVNSLMTEKVLNQNGFRTKLHGVSKPEDIVTVINQSSEPISHVIVEAPWIPTATFSMLCDKYQDTQFICRSHSQVSFLQADRNAFKLIREYANLEDSSTNFHLAVNNTFIGDFIQYGYGKFVLYLPNLYYMDRTITNRWKQVNGQVNLGSFGSARVGKNHLTAIAAAVIFKTVYRYNVNFYMNSGRDEQTGILNIARDMVQGVPGFNLQFVSWSEWPDFRHEVANLHCHLQLSSTESFNICSADAAAVCVPTVCGPAISWLPNDFKVNIDSPKEAANKIFQLINDVDAGNRAQVALSNYNKESIKIWTNYLINNVSTPSPLL